MDLVINGCRIWSSNKWLHLSQKRDEAWSQLNVNVHILHNSSDIRRSFSNNTAQAHTTCRSGNSTWHLFEQLWSSKSPSLVHARDTSVVAEASLCRHQSIPGSLDIQTYPNPTTIFIYFPRFHFGGGSTWLRMFELRLQQYGFWLWTCRWSLLETVGFRWLSCFVAQLPARQFEMSGIKMSEGHLSCSKQPTLSCDGYQYSTSCIKSYRYMDEWWMIMFHWPMSWTLASNQYTYSIICTFQTRWPSHPDTPLPVVQLHESLKHVVTSAL